MDFDKRNFSMLPPRHDSLHLDHLNSLSNVSMTLFEISEPIYVHKSGLLKRSEQANSANIALTLNRSLASLTISPHHSNRGQLNEDFY